MAADDAWTVIREVENYDRTIRGVKAAALKPATAPDVVRAGFQLTKLRLPANLAFEVSGPRELTVALDADARNVAIERLAGAWRVEEREAEELNDLILRLPNSIDATNLTRLLNPEFQPKYVYKKACNKNDELRVRSLMAKMDL